jgi:hypothetical protein
LTFSDRNGNIRNIRCCLRISCNISRKNMVWIPRTPTSRTRSEESSAPMRARLRSSSPIVKRKPNSNWLY